MVNKAIYGDCMVIARYGTLLWSFWGGYCINYHWARYGSFCESEVSLCERYGSFPDWYCSFLDETVRILYGTARFVLKV